ncbi:redoxin domain-containing protein [Granulicoccus sp. GXG6511]|uniref:redoxin domain-containing protein n=1 Tax=Granulicoccus sp. GXG6511 TaxID=3381351 RepID=UPI003D7EEE9E
MTALAVGDRVDSFDGVNQFGQSVTIGAGSAWLVFFYPFAFTGICSSELRALDEMRRPLRDVGVRLAAVSCDSMFALRVFSDAEHFSFDLVSDHWPHGAIAERFGVFDARRGCALRGSFLVDQDRTVRWRTVQNLGQPRDMNAHLAAARELAADR